MSDKIDGSRQIAIAETWQLPDGTWRRGPFIEYSEEDLLELKQRSGADSCRPPYLLDSHKAEPNPSPQG